jgi:hypothetical protein
MMIDHLPKQLEAWHDFYLVVGTGAAALTGLLFVIVSLGPHVVAGHTQTGMRAFVSPIATHFTTVLVASSVMLVPELSMPLHGTLLAAGGFGGLIYTAWTRVHGRWRESKLPFLDWIWFVGLPAACYALLLASGVAIAMSLAIGLYAVAGAMLLLVVVGIRNAWDVVLWVAQQPRPEGAEKKTERLRGNVRKR